MNSKIDGRIERFGYNLPEVMKLPVKLLWHPLLFDWAATTFSLGYALVMLFMGPAAMHLGIWRGPFVIPFSGYVLAFAGTMLVASVMGLVGLAKLNRTLRMKSSFFLVLAYAWSAVYYVKVMPLPWQVVFVFGFHGLMECAVYLRTASDPRHLWDHAEGNPRD